MKVIALNGSPRKEWNTAQILQSALEEARAQGAQTELVQLNELHYSGCRSCFACKRLGSPSFGRCALGDDLKPVLERILAADVVLFGSPIYFGQISASLRAVLERLWFASLNYDKERTVNYPRTTVCGLIFTMNVAKPEMYDHVYKELTANMERLVGPTQALAIADTLQFDDYDKYLSTMFDAEAKRRHHDEAFGQDKERAAQFAAALMHKAAQR